MTWSELKVRNVDLEAKVELAWAVLYAVTFTVVRWVGNRLILGSAYVTQDRQRLSLPERIVEEVWLAVVSLAFLVASWMTFLNNDVGASIVNTHPMIRGWPMNSVAFDAVYLFRVHTGWYIHQMTRGWTASGVPIDSLMFYHHVGTLLIIVFGELTNLLLAGVLTLAVFNISNPFLHMSKIAHTLSWTGRPKSILFVLFGLAFFISRIVLLPMSIMKLGYIDAYKEDYERFGTDLILLGNIMMLFLYGLQIFWMSKIIKVIRSGRTGTTPKRSNERRTVFSETRPLNGKSKEN